MNKYLKNIILSIGILAFQLPMAHAQVKDAMVWTSLEFEKKLGSRIDFCISQEFRFGQQISMFSKHLNQIGFSYQINDFLQIGGNYRFSEKVNVGENIQFDHRYGLEFKVQQKYHRLNYSYKNLASLSYQQIYSSPGGFSPSFYNQGKFQLGYLLSRRITLKTSYEYYLPLNGKRKLSIDENRYQLGFEYILNRWLVINPYYLISIETNRNNPDYLFVSGINLSFKF